MGDVVPIDIAKARLQFVLRDIVQERQAQDERFGEQLDKSWPRWQTVLDEEVGEVARCINEAADANVPVIAMKEEVYIAFYSEVIQVAAVAVKMAERLIQARYHDKAPD